MSNYIERMNNELSELQIKINKLSDFINNNKIYAELSILKQGLMLSQLNIMTAYAVILQLRINEEMKNVR